MGPNSRLATWRRFLNPSSNREIWWLLGVLVLATVVRCWGIQHDLPYSYYGDESHFINRSLSFGSGDLNPHWFHKPAFYMYVLFAEYGLYFLIGTVNGTWLSVDDFAVSYILNPGPFILIGRLTTLAFSVASMVFVYLIGNRHFGRGVGVIAALLLALTFGDIEASRVVKADVPASFFAVASTYALLRFRQHGNTRDLILCGALAGVGAATKYYTLVLLLPICAAILLNVKESCRQQAFKRFSSLSAMAVAAFAISFFIASPFNLLDETGRDQTFGRVYEMARRSKQVVGAETTEQPDDFNNARASLPVGTVQYAQVLLSPQGMGLIIGSICLFGVVASITSRDSKLYLLLVFPLTFAAVSIFAYPGYAEPRHQCPIYPFLAVAGAIGVVRVGDLVASAWGTRVRTAMMATILIAMLLPLSGIVDRCRDLSREDTRNVAKRWIESNISGGSKLLLAEFGPPLLLDEACLNEMIQSAQQQADPNGQFTAHFGTYLDYQLKAAEEHVAYNVFEIRLPWWRSSFDEQGVRTLDSEYDSDMGNPVRPVGIESYEYYVDNGYQYAIVHSDQYERFLKENSLYRRRFPAYTRFYRELFERGQLLSEFEPGEQMRGPVVKIYQL